MGDPSMGDLAMGELMAEEDATGANQDAADVQSSDVPEPSKVYAKPTADDWARLFGAQRASELSSPVPAPQPSKPSAQDWARLFGAKRASELPESPTPVDMPTTVEEVDQDDAKASEVAAEVDATTEATLEPLSVKDAKAMKVVELREALADRALPTDGLKPVLIARLLAAIAAPQ